MIKKLLARLINWEGSQKSNWTKAMEAQDFSEDERKKIIDKAREGLNKEQMRTEDTQESVEEGLDKAA